VGGFFVRVRASLAQVEAGEAGSRRAGLQQPNRPQRWLSENFTPIRATRADTAGRWPCAVRKIYISLETQIPPPGRYINNLDKVITKNLSADFTHWFGKPNPPEVYLVISMAWEDGTTLAP
jgi:hypothetical protein